MNWSGPNVIYFGRKSQFGPDHFILVETLLFWSRPNHYGQVKINLVRPKPFWTDQNCFGHIEGQGIRVYLFVLTCCQCKKQYSILLKFELAINNLSIGGLQLHFRHVHVFPAQ